MTPLLARARELDGGDVLAFLVCSAIVLICSLVAIAKTREALWPKQIGNRMRRFFGPEVKLLQAHEKTYPGWDLGSLSRAVASFVDECCTHADRVGSITHTNSVQPLIPSEKNDAKITAKASPLTYERLPVDVDRDESFVSNVLYFATVRPDAAARAHASSSGRVSVAQFTLSPREGTAAPRAGLWTERVAIFLARDTTTAVDDSIDAFYEDARTHASSSQSVSRLQLSIACRSRDVADFFFAEIERRRQSLSVYRGKVIEPVVNNAGVQSVGFRKVQPMRAEDLELPPNVKELIDNSIVAFHENRDALSSLGVELKRGVLFHSPPGTGKTSICRYLAGALPNFTVCFVSGRRLLYPRELCRMARYLQPAMLVFEDIDLIAQERDHNGLATILGELMNQIDECEPDEQVLFIMNTNSLERLENAVRNRPGRVDQIVDVPLPDPAARARLLRLFSKSFAPDDTALSRVAAATEGATPATLKEVVKRAAVMSLRRTNADGKSTAAPPIQINAEDLLLAYEQVGRMRSEI
jgi:energy-coupling factor transporter ATP-binding protein EcfA2